MNTLVSIIREYVVSRRLIVRGDRLLVGVSGGPDSVFLLEQLRILQRDYRLRLYVAHVNHSLRGKESDADEVFVRELAFRGGFPFFRCRVDTARVAREKKISLEDAGRILRYNFFLNLCNVQSIDKIVLAHTRDDQAETVLMRLMRGTGITGLCAMRPWTLMEGTPVIRPLLEIEKTRILRYLRERGIDNRIDATNLVPEFFRNKVRLEVIPFLEKMSPHIKDNLFRLAENAQEADDFLRQAARRVYARLVTRRSDGSLCVARKSFARLMPAQRSGLIRAVLLSLLGGMQGIDSKHVRIAGDFMNKKNGVGHFINLPKGIALTQSRDYYVFRVAGLKKSKRRKSVSARLPLGRSVAVPELGYSFSARVVRKHPDLKGHSRMIEYFDRDKLSMPLRIRTRKDGDVVHPLGSGGSKKLKRFFIDEKIDNSDKDKIPLIVSGKRIVWVVGVRISDYHKVSANTRCIVRISAEKLKS